MKSIKMPFLIRKALIRRRFSVVILNWMIILSILPICLIGYMWTSERITQGNNDAEKLKNEYIEIQKALIKTQIDALIQDIDFELDMIVKYDLKSSKNTAIEFDAKLRQEILAKINKLKFGTEGYIYVNTLDGKALIYDGILQKKPLDIFKSGNKQWIDIYSLMRSKLKGDQGQFFKYVFKDPSSDAQSFKMSYVRKYDRLEWIIGTGVYYDEIDKTINIERAKIKDRIQNDIFHLALLIVFMIIILIIVNKIINKSIREDITAFKKVFSKAANDFTMVDLDTMKHEEFQDLAASANKMIEERNHFFHALSQEHLLLRSLIDAVPNLIFYKDINSRYLGCNHAFAEYMGHDESEIIGYTDSDLLGAERATIYHETDRKLLESKKLMKNEELITYSDGKQLRYETIKTTFNDVDGNVQGIIGISHDITARYEMEEQLMIAKNQAEESNRLKTAFLANMSHEIRTPLNAIIGFSNLLVFDDVEQEDKETYSRLITQSGDSLANLINDIVDMAKIESGQVAVENKLFSVNELMQDLLIIYRERVIQIEMPITMKYDPDSLYPELSLNTDQYRLKQVIMNLLNNALKFSEKGTVTYGYRVKDGYCNFFVQDQGIGIKEQSLKVIFDAFTQVDGTYSRQYGGVGLGLSISKRLVELMDGQIWVESEPGVGSKFSFRLPVPY
jgi:PAS domain S-box-containing protein